MRFLEVGQTFFGGFGRTFFFGGSGGFLTARLFTARRGFEIVQLFGSVIPGDGVTLQTKIIDVVVVQRQLTQGTGEGVDHILGFDDDGFGRRSHKAGDAGEFAGTVQHRHAGIVHDHDFADETVGFFHQHDVEILTVLDVQAHLGAANTDGRDRGVQSHGVGIGLGDLAGHKGEHTLHHRHGHGPFLGTRVIDHFIEHHAAVFGHGECGFIGEDHAHRTIGIGFKNVALIDGITNLQFHARTVGAHRRYGTVHLFDLANRLFSNGLRTCLGYHSDIVGTGQTLRQITTHFRTRGRHDIGSRILHEVIRDHHFAAIRPGQNQIGTLVGILRRRRVEAFGKRQRFAGRCLQSGAGAFARQTGDVVVGSHGSKPSDANKSVPCVRCKPAFEPRPGTQNAAQIPGTDDAVPVLATAKRTEKCWYFYGQLSAAGISPSTDRRARDDIRKAIDLGVTSIGRMDNLL